MTEILGELLLMHGATFTVVTDGLQAVNEFKRAEPGTYDAVFMDIQMPVDMRQPGRFEIWIIQMQSP